MSGNGVKYSVESSSPPINSNPKVNKLRQVIDSNSSAGGWEKSWEQGLTPWDLGQPTPVILHLNQIGALPKGRVLVPGCGSGQDVVAMACPERYVVGLDISESAINKAVELSSSSPNIHYFTFVKEDFFTWCPTELFDLIYDYTFFCAIGLELRPAWAKKIEELLKPDGELITLMFPYSRVILSSESSHGRLATMSVDLHITYLFPIMKSCCILWASRQYPLRTTNWPLGLERHGREKLGRWKRFVSRPSSL